MVSGKLYLEGILRMVRSWKRLPREAVDALLFQCSKSGWTGL